MFHRGGGEAIGYYYSNQYLHLLILPKIHRSGGFVIGLFKN